MERAYAGGVDMADVAIPRSPRHRHATGRRHGVDRRQRGPSGRLPAGKKIPITSVKANIGHALGGGRAGRSHQDRALHAARRVSAGDQRPQPQPENRLGQSARLRAVGAGPLAEPGNGRPRRAGVNAFGIGGLNMHVVLDEWTESARQLVPAVAAGSPSLPSDPDCAVGGGHRHGMHLPAAPHVPGYWDLLASGRDAKSPAPPDRWRADLAHRPGPPQPYRSPVTYGGYITDFHYDWRAHKIPPKQIEQADPLQFMLMDSADQALRDAGYDKKAFDRTRAGVVVGTEFGGDFAFQLQMALRLPDMDKILRSLLSRYGVPADRAGQIEANFGEALLRHWPALIDESGSFSTSALASRISKTWDLMGGAAAIDGGENSALAALTLADRSVVGRRL